MNWAVELGEYDVKFERRTVIKAQALADFLQETTHLPEERIWQGFVDGSVTKEG